MRISPAQGRSNPRQLQEGHGSESRGLFAPIQSCTLALAAGHCYVGRNSQVGAWHRTSTFRQVFQRSTCRHSVNTRLEARRHGRQLVDPRSGTHSALLCRSALGLIGVYNLLPQYIVDAGSVSFFQSLLQGLVRDRARRGLDGWEDTLSPRLELHRHPLLSVV